MQLQPTVMQYADGTPVPGPQGWARRRVELLDLVQTHVFGALPAAQAGTVELIGDHPVASLGQCRHRTFRLSFGETRRLSFVVDWYQPQSAGPCPAVIYGDMCWRYMTEAIMLDILSRGYGLATFNRLELAHDVNGQPRAGGLYGLCPEGDFGAVAAWAWGYHRVVDLLVSLPEVDAARIGVFGHSRGGKASLLAGATDERIALTGANNSGCAGAGSFQCEGVGSEPLARIATVFPHWFCPRFQTYVGHEAELPLDMHCLKAAVAPRALLTTEGLDDLWANPSGTWQSHLAAREAFALFGAEAAAGIVFRPGGHGHGRVDWAAFLDFADARLRGLPSVRAFDQAPP